MTDMATSGGTALGQGGGGNEGEGKRMSGTGKPRKRTKTGCLTCRKRRTKCDEGQPVCNNCVKSKRICEGYNTKYVWKADTIGAHPSGAIPWGPHGAHNVGDPMQMTASHSRSAGPSGRLQTIAPRPTTFSYPPNQPLIPGDASALSHGFPGYDLGPVGFDPQMLPVVPASDERTPDQRFLGPVPVPFSHPELNQHLGSDAQPGPRKDSSSRFPEPSLPAETLDSGPFVSVQIAQDAFDVAPELPHVLPNQDKPRNPLPAQQMSDEGDSERESNDEEWHIQAVKANIQTLNRYQMVDRPRFYADYAQSTAIGEYMRSPHATELRDDAKRQLFEHFMRVTGPTMSLYERHPFDPQERQWTSADRGNSAWEFTFPLMSFQHPGLLHAILAMSSLQISKLQGSPPTAAHRHYHIALRRVAKNVNLEHKRRHLATLAAILLLAYFEIWNSDHAKWTSHLYGACMVFAEMPLLAMARRCLPFKRRKILQQQRMMNWPNADFGADFDLDYDLLSTITGTKLTASYYNLEAESLVLDQGPPPTAKELDTFENIMDLFWWHCKMDVYQCMLSGTKLLTEYRDWTRCPPRAAASSMSSIYGTYDHLLLLLGRLANFASRDTSRKRAASRARASAPAGTPSPPFSGMLPTQDRFQAPRGFDTPKVDPRAADAPDGSEGQASYSAALQEWQDICSAFQVFEKCLGRDFAPLSGEFADNRQTPFGPSKQYRTFSVAGIWMNYNMGMIHLHRSHPDMPPTALQSTGMAARTTARYAQEIGRIAAGLSGESSSMNEIHTALAAAYIESAFCLFYAAVQYQDDNQRRWVIERMHDITRLTGWQSARQIADGCEGGWIKAAQMGRGPPYTRMASQSQPQESIWTSARRIDRRIQELQENSMADGMSDRRVALPMTERAHYALGVLGVEADFQNLELVDETFLKPGQ